ncbi:MAG: HAMP domain-containing histidine kinase [bacterium]|nr:HAMP domain-containing histidine kinase [bacterium]
MNQIKKMTDEDKKALAIMAHDLKAPLSAVIDLLDVINKGYVTDAAKIKELVARATQKSETVIVMLDDILDYTLLVNKALMKRGPVDIFNVVRESTSTIQAYATERNITVTYLKEPGHENFVDGNYTFLLRVFNNIVMNAAKYNKENGEITIDYVVNPETNNVTVTVADTGIGIPEEDMDKVFRIFERGKNARRNVNGSLGLGLSLVKQIIEDHNGKIDISSTVGVGTTVKVTLPLILEGGTK